MDPLRYGSFVRRNNRMRWCGVTNGMAVLGFRHEEMEIQIRSEIVRY
jgi:hypothetical protein